MSLNLLISDIFYLGANLALIRGNSSGFGTGFRILISADAGFVISYGIAIGIGGLAGVIF